MDAASDGSDEDERMVPIMFAMKPECELQGPEEISNGVGTNVLVISMIQS